MITRGYASLEVEQTYSRARELCHQIGDSTELPLALYGLWQSAGSRPDLLKMRILAEQLLTLAQDHKDPTLRLLAGFAMGFVLYWLGEFTSARAPSASSDPLGEQSELVRNRVLFLTRIDDGHS